MRRIGARPWALAMGLAALAWSEDAAAAEPVVTEPCPYDVWTCARAPLYFEADDEFLPVAFDFDTGFIPSGSPVQVRLAAELASTTYLQLSGEFRSFWLYPDTPDDSIFIETPGAPMGGTLGYHWGLMTAAEAKIDVSAGGFGVTWQGPIPYIPQIDFQVTDEVVFDDWGWAPGVTSTSSTQPLLLATVDLLPLLGVSIPGIKAGFQISAQLEAEVTWIADRIVVRTTSFEDVVGGPIRVDQPDTLHAFPGGAFTELDVHPEGRVAVDGTLHLIPALFISFAGASWSLDIVDVPIPLPETESDWVFEPQRVHVELPDLAVEEKGQFLDLGTVVVGEETYANFHLRNDGEAAAVAKIVSSNPTVFPSYDAVIEVEAGDASKGTFRFVPTEAGVFEASITIVTNDPDDPVTTLAVIGRGVLADGEAPPFALSPSVEAESGCGCHLPGGESPTGSGWMGLLAAAGLVGARRRARRG